MRRVVLGMLFVCACGARSEISGEGLFDGSVSFDASNVLDGSKQGDGSPFGNDGGTTGLDAGVTCMASTIAVGCANACLNCKFDVEWTCGDTKFRVAGFCDPSTLFPDAGFFQGVCQEDGQQTSSFKEPATTCDCTDASALITEVQEKCQHQ